MISWLGNEIVFPPLSEALSEPNGLICAGGDLSPQRLIAAYQNGIFPWYSKGEPLLWWSPDPRMVLLPNEFKISASLRKILQRGAYEIRLDDQCAALITACATSPRKGQAGTWITSEMQAAYTELFRQGFAHSVEVWMEGQLVGGLYGLALGKMFYGESMFARVSNASKIALAHLTRFLAEQGFGLIDCQMNTPHLASLGAREMTRSAFYAQLQKLIAQAPLSARWPINAASYPSTTWRL